MVTNDNRRDVGKFCNLSPASPKQLTQLTSVLSGPPPTFYLKDHEATLGMKDYEVGVKALWTNGDVIPTVIVIFQFTLKSLSKTLLSGNHRAETGAKARN
jgi:hypothetical protein